MWLVASDGNQQASFPSAFRRSQNQRIEKGTGGRDSSDDDVSSAELVFEQTAVFAVLRANEAEFSVHPAFVGFDVVIDVQEGFEKGLGPC